MRKRRELHDLALMVFGIALNRNADAAGARPLTGDPVTEAENIEWPL